VSLIAMLQPYAKPFAPTYYPTSHFLFLLNQSKCLTRVIAGNINHCNYAISFHLPFEILAVRRADLLLLE
jgi:hypothetical protein